MVKQKSERRRFKRIDLACPIEISGHQGHFQARGRTINVSDGGVMISIPAKIVPHVKEKIKVTVSIPRITPNTRMIEKIDSLATVLRHQERPDENLSEIALRFTKPKKLELEV